MAEENIKEKQEVRERTGQGSAETARLSSAPARSPRRPDTRGRFPLRRKNVRRSGREGRARQEYDQKLINIRRVVRVSSGGRRFSFSVAMILGNRRGSVGVGTGKSGDTAGAIGKAMRSARKNMITVRHTPSFSIPHRVEAKYSSARVMLSPAPGRGVVAGSAVRSVLELCGIRDVTAKILSPSKNALNVARATIQALAAVRSTTATVPAETTPTIATAAEGEQNRNSSARAA